MTTGLPGATMLDANLLELLCCPTCHGALSAHLHQAGDARYPKGTLRCDSCGEGYPVARGVLDLVPRDLPTEDGWGRWHEHLAAFQARRALRVREPSMLVSRLSSRKTGVQQAFSCFSGITAGRVLDVGCGPGKFR